MDFREGLASYIKQQKHRDHGSGGTGITPCQKIVLQKRKNYISEEAEGAAEELIMGMRQRDMIEDEFMKFLKEEKSPSGQVQLLIELILVSKHAIAFDVFMELLFEKYEPLVTEIRTEVRYEEGVSSVDEEVAKEAGTLVHKKFGTSKRWGEGDKKDLIDLLAVKIQLLNEDWQKKIQTTEDEVSKLTNIINKKDKIVHEVLKELKEFVTYHDRQLTNHAHGMTTTSQHLVEVFDNPKQDPLNKVQDATHGFLQRVDQILYQRDGLMEERSKCYAILDVKDKRKDLDRALKQKLDALNGAIARAKENDVENGSSDEKSEDLSIEVSRQADVIKQLNKRLTNMEEELVKKDDMIESLQKK